MELYPTQFADRLVSVTSDAIIYANAEGVIRLWNPRRDRIVGFAEEEALGRSLDIIIPEGLRERHWQGFRATMSTGQSRYGDGQILSVPAVRKDGVRFSVEFTIVPFANESGHIIDIAAIMRDTTTGLGSCASRLVGKSRQRIPVFQAPKKQGILTWIVRRRAVTETACRRYVARLRRSHRRRGSPKVPLQRW
jgi:PAS domain S-box-containing protein